MDETKGVEPVGNKRLRKPLATIGRRDVLVTLAIILFAAVVFVVINRPWEPGEGNFVENSFFGSGFPQGPAPSVGTLAPDFEVPLLGGGTFRLSEQRGRPVWINFWATWCPPCRVEMPDMQKVWEAEKESDLVLIAVDFAESRNTVQEFADRLGLTFDIGLDTFGSITGQYRVAGFPSHFMVDRNGILREIRVGLMHEETMYEKLERLRQY